MVKHGFARVNISRWVEQGILISIGHGGYATPEALENPLYSLAEVALRAPKAIICLHSALHFHGLTLERPHALWIALPKGVHAPRRASIRLNTTHFSGNAYELGAQAHTILGVDVKVYSPAKTVIDCFRLRNRIGLETAINALEAVIQNHRVTRDELWLLAKTCGIQTVIQPYLEALR